MRYDAGGGVIGLTILGALALLERDGEISVTLPTLRLDADTIRPALTGVS